MTARIGAFLAVLALGLPATLVAQDEGAAEVKKLSADYQEAMQKLAQEYRAEQDQAKKQAIINDQLPALRAEYSEKFQALAEKYAKQPAGIEALVMVCSLNFSDRERLKTTTEKLLDDHLDDDALAMAIPLLMRADGEVLDKLAKSKSRSVQGVALYYQMSSLKGRALSEDNEKQVVPLMKRIKNEFGDVELKMPGGTSRGTLGKMVDNELFAYENLRIGKVAPDIQGEDVSGVTFKLSDYRGKVVVIDFWGDW